MAEQPLHVRVGRSTPVHIHVSKKHGDAQGVDRKGVLKAAKISAPLRDATNTNRSLRHGDIVATALAQARRCEEKRDDLIRSVHKHK